MEDVTPLKDSDNVASIRSLSPPSLFEMHRLSLRPLP